jgi:ParB family chromosome partitioning protein
MTHSLYSEASGALFRTIPVQALHFPDDFTGCLYPDVDDSLCHLVHTYGLLQPLPVQRLTNRTCRLLAGYPFLPVLRHLGVQSVCCQIIAEDTFPTTLYAVQILHSLSTLAESSILQAHLLRQARNHLTEEELLGLLSLMGHKPQRHKIQELLALLALVPEAVLALHRGHLSVKSGKMISRLPPQDQQHLVELLLRYRAGGSKQHKLIELLTELSLRHQAPLAALTHPWLTKQQDDPVNLPQQLQGLLRFLHAQCFPHLAEAERGFQQFLEELAPPPQARIEHSPFFEDDSMEVSLHFSDRAALQRFWPLMKEIFPGGTGP